MSQGCPGVNLGAGQRERKGAKISAGHREELLHLRLKTHPTGLYKVYELSLPGSLGEEILGIHNHNPGISSRSQHLFRNFPALRFSVRGKTSNVSFFTLYTTLHFVHLNFNLKGLESQSLILKDNVTFVSRVLLFCLKTELGFWALRFLFRISRLPPLFFPIISRNKVQCFLSDSCK